MEIRTALDQKRSQGTAGSSDTAFEPANKFFKGITATVILIFVVAAVMIAGIFASIRKMQHDDYPAPVQEISGSGKEQASSGDEILYLKKTGDGSYTLSSQEAGADKKIVWDPDYESYYDKESDCWLWYNTDVEPALWQYWYEGISSDFGDYGWMEHESSGWFIETDDGKWINLPDNYKTDGLWYIK